MKKIILFFSLIPLFSIAQVGIGTTDPRTTLDVVGAITNREVSFAVASNAVTIATETSLANITGSATATIAVTSFTPTVNGCRLIISNNTTGGFGATFAGMTIPNSQAIEFVYTNGGWKTTAGGTGAANNIYNSNGTLSGNRTVTQGANTLTFNSTAVNGFSVDGTTFSVDATNNRVGIGTSSPTTTLDVGGNFKIYGNAIGDFSGAELRPHVNTGSFTVYSGIVGTGTPRFTVTNGGNVGIGTLTPSAQFHTTGTVRFAGAGTPSDGRSLVTDATGLATWQNPLASNSTSTAITASTTQVAVPSTNVQGAISDLATAIKTVSANDWRLDGNSNGVIKKFGTIDAFDLPFITNNVERMRIKSGGSIGIGTANPLGKLNVSGGFVVGTGTNGANTAGIPFTFGDSTNSAIWFGNYDNTASSDYGVMYLQPTAGDTATLNIIAGDNASGGAADESVFIGNMDFSGTKKGVTVKNGFTGIGTTAPTAQLHTTGSVLFAGAGTPILGRSLVTDATGLATWQNPLASNSTSTAIAASATQVAVPSTNVQGSIGDLATAIRTAQNSTIYNSNGTLTGNRVVTQGANTLTFNSTAVNGFSVDGTTFSVDGANDRIGIGTTNPTKKLTVENGSIRPAIGNTQDSGISFPTDIGGGSGDEAFIRYYVESGENTKLSIGTNNDFDDDISFFQAGAERMNIYNGNVGIGINLPTAQLHTTGSVRFAGAGTPILGRSLVTDATGLATWQNPLASNSTSTAIAASATQVAVPSTNVQGAIGDLATAIRTAQNSTIYTSDGTLTSNRTVTQGANTLTFNSTAVNGFSVDGTTFSVDGTNNRVGIGNIAPNLSLDVTSSNGIGTKASNASQWDHLYLFSDTVSSYITAGGAENGLRFRVGSDASGTYGGQTYTTAMTIMPSGNIGIGTTNPNAPLQFANTFSNRKTVLWQDADNEHQFYGFGINANILRYQVGAIGSSHIFYAGTGATTSDELMRIQGNGRVGIGTNNPRGKFNISGGMVVGSGTFGGSTVGIPFGYGDTTNSALWFGNYDNTNTNDYGLIYFQQNATNVSTLNILSGDDSTGGTLDDSVFIGNVDTSSAKRGITVKSGHVGIGTTTPLAKLDLIGAKTTGAGLGTGAANDGPSQAIIPAGNNGTSRFNDWPAGWGGGLSTFDIVGASTFMNGYLTRSDFRLKNDIKSVDNSIFSNFMKIRPVTYFMKEQTKETEGLQYGFIAQEIRDLFPSMVTKSDDPNGIIGMNYQALISPTIYVVQQQQAKIDELQKQVDSQNEKLSKMEEELQQIKQLLSK